MKKNRIKSLIPQIALLLSLVMMISTTYAWFFAGKSIYNIGIETKAVDCKINLYRVEDANFGNGVYDNSFDYPEFELIRTTKQSAENDEIYLGKNEHSNLKLTPFDDEGESGEYGYIIEDNSLSDYKDTVRLVADNQNDRLFYNLESIYPTLVVSYAVSISSSNSSHVGKVDITVDVKDDKTGKIEEVVTINHGNYKKLLYNEKYQGLSTVSVFDNDDLLTVLAGETLWVFFYFKFEALDSLKEIERQLRTDPQTKQPESGQGKFEQMTNLNQYENLASPAAKLTVSYYLTEIKGD